jgi:photosystem II stability/assembly factor-like uncharacterized protein
MAAVQRWVPVGPDGGDARSFAADPSNPSHLYLGTTTGWIYQTDDGGDHWRPLTKLPSSENLIVDNIVVDKTDPNTLYVGAWVIDLRDGGVFVSHDAGKSWTEVPVLKGQPVQALAQSDSNPKILVAGTLQGVFRSEDGGVQWKQISPLGSLELHEVESVAIDPKDPQIIYAGTWHLPWKTTDGGATWHNIKQGLIDDSDVFSIIIDPQQTNVVYTSACSGIYRSDNGGEVYHKIQGIPSTARRTRVLMQDPVNRDIVYAGTTEGLYKTVNGGVHWDRMTGPDVIINDVYVDPRNPQHVLLATDRSGVLKSENGATSFTASNTGFSQRQVTTLLVDAKTPRTVYAGVVNDKTYGGVFVSNDNGASWLQQSEGLGGRDVYSLAQGSNGVLLAGTNAGIFRWDGSMWQSDGKIVVPQEKVSYVIKRGKRTRVQTTISVPGGQIEDRVSAIDAGGQIWSAATSKGIYISDNQGASWKPTQGIGKSDFSMLAASGDTVLAAQRKMLALSLDGGKQWQPLAMPSKLGWLDAITVAPDGSLWLGGGEGVFYSQDQGQNWQQMSRLPISDISGVGYDSGLGRIVVTSWRSTWVLGVNPSDRTWKWWDAGWNVRNVHSSGGRLLGTTLFNGVVTQSNSVPPAADLAARN